MEFASAVRMQHGIRPSKMSGYFALSSGRQIANLGRVILNAETESCSGRVRMNVPVVVVVVVVVALLSQKASLQAPGERNEAR